MIVGDKISEFMTYWCKFKCPYRGKDIFNDDPMTVDVDDYDLDCTCPKCGEEFRDPIYGTDINYEFDSYNFPDKYCECCQVKEFVEALRFELG